MVAGLLQSNLQLVSLPDNQYIKRGAREERKQVEEENNLKQYRGFESLHYNEQRLRFHCLHPFIDGNRHHELHNIILAREGPRSSYWVGENGSGTIILVCIC